METVTYGVSRVLVYGNSGSDGNCETSGDRCFADNDNGNVMEVPTSRAVSGGDSDPGGGKVGNGGDEGSEVIVVACYTALLQ